MAAVYVALCGTTEGIDLYGLQGFDWKGAAYDRARPVVHMMAIERARRCRQVQGPGLYLVMGSNRCPSFSWPVWALVK